MYYDPPPPHEGSPRLRSDIDFCACCVLSGSDMASCNQVWLAPKEISAMMKVLDEDGSGEIDYGPIAVEFSAR
eukprot:2890201-Rhodomonas_salina.1